MESRGTSSEREVTTVTRAAPASMTPAVSVDERTDPLDALARDAASDEPAPDSTSSEPKPVLDEPAPSELASDGLATGERVRGASPRQPPQRVATEPRSIAVEVAAPRTRAHTMEPHSAPNDQAAVSPRGGSGAERAILWTNPRSALEFAPGRLAYLVCEGVALRAGPYPCPRDPALEEAVWSSLRGLAECLPQPRSGDIRLRFEADSGPALEIRAIPRAPETTIRESELRRCTGNSLTELRQGLNAERLVVSFRFRARRSS